jgi:hypothetical protein
MDECAVITEELAMKTLTIKPVQCGCCRCSRKVPEKEMPIVVCECCGRIYCLPCLEAAELYLRLSAERVSAALGSPKERLCLEELFAAIDKALQGELLECLPVPPREKGH